jgi:hypothetical protein
MEVRPLLTIFRFHESENREHSIWIREVAKSENSKKAGSSIVGPVQEDVSKFHHFGISEGKGSRLSSRKSRSGE